MLVSPEASCRSCRFSFSVAQDVIFILLMIFLIISFLVSSPALYSATAAQFSAGTAGS